MGTELMFKPPPTVERLQTVFEHVGRIVKVLLAQKVSPDEISSAASAEGRNEAITHHIELHQKHYSGREAELPHLSHLAEQIFGGCRGDHHAPAIAQTAATLPAAQQPAVAQSPARITGTHGPPAHGSLAAVFAIGHRWSSALRPTAKVWLKDRYGR